MQTTASDSRGTVTVACKIPQGLILRLFKMEDRTEGGIGGTTYTTKVALPVGPRYVINGPGYDKNDGLPDYTIKERAALTHGIPLDFWEEWMKQNQDSECVRNNLVFSAKSGSEAIARAKEFRSARSGFEPIDPGVDAKGKAADPRMPNAS